MKRKYLYCNKHIIGRFKCRKYVYIYIPVDVVEAELVAGTLAVVAKEAELVEGTLVEADVVVDVLVVDTEVDVADAIWVNRK